MSSSFAGGPAEPGPDTPQVPWGVPRQQSGQEQRATTRLRQYVAGLPSWEPTPPGEILVQRHRPE